MSGASASLGAQVTVGLLDGFELRHGADTVELALGAQRLVAYLALHEKRLQRRYVAARLWMDASAERANGNLRSAVWRVQRTGLPIVECTSSQLALQREVVVDARESTRFALEVLDHRHAVPPAGWQMLGADLVPDWYEDWIDAERERFRQLRLHALEELCVQLIEVGRFGEAVQVGLTAAAGDPTRESAQRAVILAYLAERNVGEAIRHYERFQRSMLREFGVPPSAELTELVRSALASTDVHVSGDGVQRSRSAKL